MTIPLRQIANALCWTSILLFGLCLFGDGYYIEGDRPRAWASAFGLLLVGWLGVGSGGAAWLANPCLLFGWIAFAMGRFHMSLFLSLSAVSLIISFLAVDRVIASEAPTFARVIGYGIGYWLWLSSAIALVGANLGPALSRSSPPRISNAP